MEINVSVVVPVYNMERLLGDCIASLKKQTLPQIEFILVNDGSSDHSAAICEAAAAEDSRFRVIHQQNKGLSGARNTGIRAAAGTYIGFVDSDDTVDPQMYDVLYSLCKDTGSEAASVASLIHYPDKTVSTGGRGLHVHTREEAMRVMLEGTHFDEVVWTKLFHRDILEHVQFTEGIIYEDTDFTYRALHETEHVASLGLPLYHYYKRDGSIMSAAAADLRDDAVEVYAGMYTFLAENYPELTTLASRKMADVCLSLLAGMAAAPDHADRRQQMRRIARRMNSIYGEAVKDEALPRKAKVLLTASKLHPVLCTYLLQRTKSVKTRPVF
ncbi:glycosyltransferase [Alkalicoccus chagannorensis]|uniref:glycosyltransferase n=1 Tax=Alkalicoccus chagannorensis TaxID=427072 RepID=UPI00041D458F|nr:glycosyltransferase [Alkalicoccus chagannorensis]